MICDPIHPDARPNDTSSRALLWLIAIFVGGVFFVVDHQWHFQSSEEFLSASEDQISTYTNDGNSLRRFSFMGLLLLGGSLIAGSRKPFHLDGNLPWIAIALATWAGLSLVWSADFGISFRRLVVISSCGIAALGVAARTTPRQLCQIAVFLIAGYALIGVCSELTSGGFGGSEYRFAGTTHPNSQGIQLAILCLGAASLAWDDRRGRVAYLLLLAVAFGLLLLTKSRTSLIAILAAFAAPSFFSMSTSKRVMFASVGFWLLAMGALFLQAVSARSASSITSVVLLGRNEQVGSFTGRVPLWSELLRYVELRPWFGYGFRAFWNPDRMDEIAAELVWVVPHAHCAYLDIVLSLGLIGGAMAVVLVLVSLHRASREYGSRPSAGTRFILGLLVLAAVQGCFESTFIEPKFASFVALCALMQLSFLRQASPQRASQGTRQYALDDSRMSPTSTDRPFGDPSAHASL